MHRDRDEFIPTRKTLLSRLRDWDDRESWRVFFDTYWKLIYSFSIKSGLSESEAEDIVQETVFSVAKQMPKFQYDAEHGSFKAWLLQITRRRISDHFRKSPRWAAQKKLPSETATGTSTAERIPDPKQVKVEDIWEEEWRQNLVEVAIERVKQQVKPKHYQIFDLYAIKGLPVREVARALNVSAAQVYLVKHRVTQLIRKEAARLEEKASGT